MEQSEQGITLISNLINKIRSFFVKTYDDIVADFNKVVHNLNEFAKREELKAEEYLDAHNTLKEWEAEARAAAAKARKAATNIGKLFD